MQAVEGMFHLRGNSNDAFGAFAIGDLAEDRSLYRDEQTLVVDDLTKPAVVNDLRAKKYTDQLVAPFMCER